MDKPVRFFNFVNNLDLLVHIHEQMGSTLRLASQATGGVDQKGI